jgi:hypothetical protein
MDAQTKEVFEVWREMYRLIVRSQPGFATAKRYQELHVKLSKEQQKALFDAQMSERA